MKIQTKKSLRKPVIITLLTLLLLVGVGVVYSYTQNIGPFEKDFSTKQTTPEEKSTGTDIKKDSLEQADKPDKTPTDNDTPSEPSPDSNGGKSTVSMEITAANQNGSVVNVRSLIQTISNTGSCHLKMTGPNGKIYTATAEVQAMPNSSTCKGFDIPTTELTPGQWTADITFENENVKGSASKELTVQ